MSSDDREGRPPTNDNMAAFIEQMGKLGEHFRNATPAAWGGAASLPALANEWLNVMRTMQNQANVPLRQLEATIAEIRARREQVRALQSQLAAFEEQLETLERTLSPVLDWSRQWMQMQESALGAFGVRGPGNRSGSSSR